jgi:hypothetical protein
MLGIDEADKREGYSRIVESTGGLYPINAPLSNWLIAMHELWLGFCYGDENPANLNVDYVIKFYSKHGEKITERYANLVINDIKKDPAYIEREKAIRS